jgi:hypothetical protein
MKCLFAVLLLSVAALGQASGSSSIPVDQENVRKAKAVINAGIQALGGDAYLNIQDLSQEGRTYSFHHGEPNSVGVLFWRFYKYPDRDRVELTKQRDVVYIYTGDKGYEVTFKGPHPDDPKNVADYIRRRHFALDWVLRKWINDPGVAFFYEGQTVAAQRPAEQVTLMNTSDEAVTLFFDINTHLPIKKSFTWRDPVDRQRNTDEEVWDNYRDIQGIMTPFSVTRFYNGDMANQRFLNSVTYNKGLADHLFEPDASRK